jgi:hypothetical protein
MLVDVFFLYLKMRNLKHCFSDKLPIRLKKSSLKILKILILIGSFLASVHEKSSLAAAITCYFEKQAQDVPEGQTIRATPSLEGIRGVLQACEDQTSAFDWQNFLLAVGATLGMSEIKA